MVPRSMRIAPFGAPIGAQVAEFDLAGLGDPHVALELREAFARHQLLLFRDLDLTVEQQIEFGRIFGEPVLREKNLDRDPSRKTQHVSNKLDDGVFGTGELDFHVDQLFWSEPLKALMLYGIDVPGNGGDTKFADCTSAYRNMPRDLRVRIDALSCRHAYTFAGDLADGWNVDDAAVQDLSAVHPIVWRGDDTEHCGIWVNEITTVEVVGLPDAEGRELIAEVRSYLYDDSITYRHQWRPGDLVLWHNRHLQHARMPFDNERARTLRRTTLM